MSVRAPARRYPRKADVARAVQAARHNGITVRSLELRADGTIRLSDAADAERRAEGDRSEFDIWNEEGRL